MDWVMVPVPEELEPQVRVLLLQLSFQAALVQWDDDSMHGHLRSLDDDSRVLLCAVAEGVLKGALIEDVALAEQLNVNVREVYGLVREANDAAAGDLVYARAEDAGENGKRRVLYMLEGYAVLVRRQAAALGLEQRTG